MEVERGREVTGHIPVMEGTMDQDPHRIALEISYLANKAIINKRNKARALEEISTINAVAVGEEAAEVGVEEALNIVQSIAPIPHFRNHVQSIYLRRPCPPQEHRERYLRNQIKIPKYNQSLRRTQLLKLLPRSHPRLHRLTPTNTLQMIS